MLLCGEERRLLWTNLFYRSYNLLQILATMTSSSPRQDEDLVLVREVMGA